MMKLNNWIEIVECGDNESDNYRIFDLLCLGCFMKFKNYFECDLFFLY